MKTTISGYLAAVLSLLTILATVPTELQAQIMALMPKSVQPYTALVFALAAFLAKLYQSKNTQDSILPPSGEAPRSSAAPATSEAASSQQILPTDEPITSNKPTP